MRYGFDLALLDSKELQNKNKRRCVSDLLANHNISSFRVVGNHYNRNAKRPLKLTNAQSTIQATFKEVTKYLHMDLGDF